MTLASRGTFWKAHRQIEGDGFGLPRLQRQAEREVGICRLDVVEKQCRLYGTQREAEWIRIGHVRPYTNGGAPRRAPGLKGRQSYFARPIGCLFKSRGLNQRAQPFE